MKSNTILVSLIIATASATIATEWETTYSRYLSKAGKASSTISGKSTKSPTIIISSGSKSSKGSGSKSSKSSGQTLTLEPSSSPSIDPISSGPTPVVTADSIAPTFDPFPPEPCDFSCPGVGGGVGVFPNPDRLLCSPDSEEEGCPFEDATCQDLQDDLAEIADNLVCRLILEGSMMLPFCCAEISSPSPSPDPFTPTTDPFATPSPSDTLTPDPTNDILAPSTSPTIDALAPTSSPSTSPTIFSKSAKSAKSSGSKSSKSTTSKSSKAAAAVAPQSAFTMFKSWWN